MITLEEITAAIERLPAEELVRVQEWLAEFVERRWDQRIERDEKSGRLDPLINRALAEHQAGRTMPLL